MDIKFEILIYLVVCIFDNFKVYNFLELYKF